MSSVNPLNFFKAGVLSILLLVGCLFSAFPLYRSSSSVMAATYHVSAADGKDTNPGTQELPFRSISASVNKAVAGDTVLISSGSYRETIYLPRSGLDEQRPIIIRSVPGADVKIKGSDLVSGWAPHSGNIWKKRPWPVNSQQVFSDELPLQQVGKNCPLNFKTYQGKILLPPVGEGFSDITPGSFWYDQIAKTLYVWLYDGSDPNKHQIEASVRDFIISPAEVNFLELHGLKFSHSNQTDKGHTMGMVNVFGGAWIISNCTFAYGDFAGIHITGEGHKITNSIFNHNGDVGININGSDEAHNWKPYDGRPPQNILLEGNETSYNNYRNFYVHWHAGGIKATTSCSTVLVSQHKALSNNGHGIWFDGWCANIIIDRCIVKNNKVGIFYEISDDALISNNLVVENTNQGIYISASSGTKVFNNTVHKNWAGIVIHGIPRAEHPSLENNTVRNNIISESELADLVFYSDSLLASGNKTDYNLYSRPEGTVKISFTKTSGYGVNYRDLKALSAATGQEKHSLTADPLWVDRLAGDFSLRSNSPAIDAGQLVQGIGGKDLAGFTRVYDGDNDGNAVIDIGAYEFQRQRLKVR